MCETHKRTRIYKMKRRKFSFSCGFLLFSVVYWTMRLAKVKYCSLIKMSAYLARNPCFMLTLFLRMLKIHRTFLQTLRKIILQLLQPVDCWLHILSFNFTQLLAQAATKVDGKSEIILCNFEETHTSNILWHLNCI